MALRNSQYCPECSNKLDQDYSRKSIMVDQTLGYYDEGLGVYVESTSHKRQILKDKGLVETKAGDTSYVTKRVETTKSKAEKKEKQRNVIKKAIYDTTNGVKPKQVATQ